MIIENFINAILNINFMNYNRFFGRDSEVVAKDLLGRLLVRKSSKGNTSVRIIETGAYTGGETESRIGMKYVPGSIFLMPYRGSYLLNIATDKRDHSSCVEVRTIKLHGRLIRGSGTIAKLLDITPDFDGMPLGSELGVVGDGVDSSMVKKTRGNTDNCDGYFSIKK